MMEDNLSCLLRKQHSVSKASCQHGSRCAAALPIDKERFDMPDKNPKNIGKHKKQAEVKHEEVEKWKHESPAEKTKIHEVEDAEKNPVPTEA
jgi:hypothetical protein